MSNPFGLDEEVAAVRSWPWVAELAERATRDAARVAWYEWRDAEWAIAYAVMEVRRALDVQQFGRAYRVGWSDDRTCVEYVLIEIRHQIEAAEPVAGRPPE